MKYRRCGKSGLLLPRISLGLWHRDEMIISTKAGYAMWEGSYGQWGSRKHVLASLEQSLRRMGLEYVDIFYSHRPDPETPLEETASALGQAVTQGKALYAGISNYSPEQTRRMAALLRDLGTPCLIHQPAYNLLHRQIEDGLTGALEAEGIGCIVFSPLAQGQLTDRYFQGHSGGFTGGSGGIPEAGHRAYKPTDDPGARRGGANPGSVPRADGTGVGAAAAGGDLGTDRGEFDGATRSQRGRARQARFLGGRTRGD